jgi:curli biogenesis system outer membrane secretion channel CsgG
MIAVDVNARQDRPSAGRLAAGLASGVVAAVVLLSQFVPVAAQTGAPKQAAPRAAAAATSGVDTVIALVKGGMSESMVLRTLKTEGKTYKLSTADLLKLQQAGVSEAIIDAMTNPSATGAGAPGAPVAAGKASSASTAAPATTGAATEYPPDLPDVPSVVKRRLAVNAFDYATVTTWVNYWFGNNLNIGEGIRSILQVKLGPSKYVTMVERGKIQEVMKEQDLGASNRVRKGTNARIGQISGADVMLYGDIVVFGRDDTSKRKGVAAVVGRFNPVAGGIVGLNKEEKAVVGINLRLVDAETSEQIEAAEARGESSRSSKDYAGILGVKGTTVGAGYSMTSSNFAETIIGEATIKAVENIVAYLEGKLPKLQAKAREIEGRIAQLTSGGAYLTVGSQDGVLRGDRFDILRINGEIKDPVTKEVIDVDAVKVGELVVDTVRDKTSSGRYGGQPLSASAVTTSGYVARLKAK